MCLVSSSHLLVFDTAAMYHLLIATTFGVKRSRVCIHVVEYRTEVTIMH